MTLKVRDEADVIEANLRYHVAQGVDFFVVTDNGSSDGTLDVLHRYRDAGLAHLIEEHSDDFKSASKEWIARMARLAGTEFEADWVINNDADEFWWPLTGRLSEVFEAIPEPYSLLNAPRPEFVGRPDGPGSFLERLVHREARSRLQYKVAHRGMPDVVLGRGSHKVRVRSGAGASKDPTAEPVVARRGRDFGRAVLRTVAQGARSDDADMLVPAPQWPVRILHFPVRSFAQYQRRVEMTLFHGDYQIRSRRGDLLRHLEEGRLSELYAKLVVDDAGVEAGLADGSLVIDRGLRDFMDGCPDPLAQGGVQTAREWAAGATDRPPDVAAQEVAANALDMMSALARGEQSLRRQRGEANRMAARRKQEQRKLRRRVRRLDRRMGRVQSRLRRRTEQRDELRAQLAATPQNRARALVRRALRRS